jgi:hypothetical protein
MNIIWIDDDAMCLYIYMAEAGVPQNAIEVHCVPV